jgi:hypothetical protein
MQTRRSMAVRNRRRAFTRARRQGVISQAYFSATQGANGSGKAQAPQRAQRARRAS